MCALGIVCVAFLKYRDLSECVPLYACLLPSCFYAKQINICFKKVMN